MDSIRFDNISTALHDLVNYHTELTIWLVIGITSFFTLRSMFYSLEVRRYMAIILTLSGLAAYGIYNYVLPPEGGGQSVVAQR